MKNLDKQIQRHIRKNLSNPEIAKSRSTIKPNFTPGTTEEISTHLDSLTKNVEKLSATIGNLTQNCRITFENIALPTADIHVEAGMTILGGRVVIIPETIINIDASTWAQDSILYIIYRESDNTVFLSETAPALGENVLAFIIVPADWDGSLSTTFAERSAYISYVEMEDIDVPDLSPITDLTLSSEAGTSDSAIKAQWSAINDPMVLGYEVSYSVDNVNWETVTVTGTEATFRVKQGITVYVKVRAFLSNGRKGNWSVVSSIVTSVDSTIPATPTITSAVAAFPTIEVKWSANTEDDFDHYIVEVDTDSAFSNAEPVVVNQPYYVFGAEPATTYYIRVKAVDFAGNESAWSTTQGIYMPEVTADSSTFIIFGDAVVDGTLTVDKLVVLPGERIDEEVAEYWVDSAIGSIGTVVPEGVDEVNPNLYDSLPSGAAIVDTLYTGQKIYVSNKVVIQKTEEGKGLISILNDSLSPIVKLGEEALPNSSDGLYISQGQLQIGETTGNYLLYDGNTLTVTGTINTGSGTIGGFTITDTYLSSSADGANGVILNKTESRLEIKNTDIIKVAVGYLNGIGTHTADDYGIYLGKANAVYVEGAAGEEVISHKSGDWVVKNNANIILKDGTGAEILRVGTNSTDLGMFIKDPATGAVVAEYTSSHMSIAGNIFNSDGTFNLSGGNLTWDGTTLNVIGTINTNSGNIGGWTIGADNINSNSLTINSSTPYIGLGVTTYGGLNGIWMGYDDVDLAWKFSIENSDGSQYLTFDGSTLSVKGELRVGQGGGGIIFEDAQFALRDGGTEGVAYNLNILNNSNNDILLLLMHTPGSTGTTSLSVYNDISSKVSMIASRFNPRIYFYALGSTGYSLTSFLTLKEFSSYALPYLDISTPIKVKVYSNALPPEGENGMIAVYDTGSDVHLVWWDSYRGRWERATFTSAV